MSVNFSFEWTLPQKVFGSDFQEEDFRNHVRQMVAISLFKEGRISSGLAAELLNISRREFFELLHQKSIPYFDMDENEIEKEWAASGQIDQEIGPKADGNRL